MHRPRSVRQADVREKRVLVRADAACPVRHVSTVVDAAARAGVVDVTFAALAR